MVMYTSAKKFLELDSVFTRNQKWCDGFLQKPTHHGSWRGRGSAVTTLSHYSRILMLPERSWRRSLPGSSSRYHICACVMNTVVSANFKISHWLHLTVIPCWFKYLLAPTGKAGVAPQRCSAASRRWCCLASTMPGPQLQCYKSVRLSLKNGDTMLFIWQTHLLYSSGQHLKPEPTPSLLRQIGCCVPGLLNSRGNETPWAVCSS